MYSTFCYATFFLALFSVSLALVSIEPVSDVVERAGGNAILYCNPDVTGGSLVWYLNITKLQTGDKYTMVAENNSLEILKVGEKDVGEYKCGFTMDGSAEVNTTVYLYAEPQMADMAPTKNVVQDDTLVLVCKVWAYPPPEVSWLKNGQALNITDTRITLSIEKGSTINNTNLRVTVINDLDEGNYTCVAVNEKGERNATIAVKVKDKLAALWPFLAICAEVAILCIIIFIYEKHHAKKLAEEEARDEPEAAHLANMNEKSDDVEVRHRK